MPQFPASFVLPTVALLLLVPPAAAHAGGGSGVGPCGGAEPHAHVEVGGFVLGACASTPLLCAMDSSVCVRPLHACAHVDDGLRPRLCFPPFA